MASAVSVASHVGTDLGKFVAKVAQSAKLGNTDVKLWRSYSNDIIDNAHSLEPIQAVKLLSCFSYMKYRHRAAMDALATRVYESCHRLSSSDITQVLRSYSVLQQKSDFMFRLMLPEISKRSDMFRIGDLSSVFYSYSNMGYYNRHLASTVELAVTHNLHQVKPRDLSQLMCALGKLKVRHKRLETILGCHFCKLLEICSYTEFSLIVNALGRLEFCNHPHLFSVVETEVYRKLKYFPAQAFSLVANAVSRREDSVKVLDFMSKEAQGRLREFDIQSLCLLSSAFSRRGHVRSELFDRMANKVGKISLSLYPRALASLTFAYSRAAHLHGPLMHFSGRHLELFPSHYSCNEAAMVLRSHNVLNIKNETMLLSLASFICETYPDLVPVEAVDTVASERVSSYMESPHLIPNKEDENEDDDSLFRFLGSSNDDEEIRHINHLEIFVEDPFNTDSGGRNFLERGLMHSLLWIVQSFSQHGVWNDKEVKGALQRVANEVACRPKQLTPLITSNMLYAYSRLNYRLDALVSLLLREVEDPRLNYVFEQEHLRLIYDALMTFGMDPNKSGVYRIRSYDLKRLMEEHRNDIDKVVRDILQQNYCTEEESDLEASLDIAVSFVNDISKSRSTSENAVTYIHIPVCIGKSSGDGASSDAFSEQLKYNFTI